MFVHIPKAAGTSLRAVISRHYPASSQLAASGPVLLSDDQRRTIRVLMGHVPYGVQSQLPPPVDVITMLRHPVERVISLYYYILERPGNELHGLASGRSLERFAACGHPQVSNDQVRQIGGTQTPSLPIAVANLTRGMTTFGIAERFSESLVLMQATLGWKNVYHRTLNVTPNRPGLRDIPRNTIKAIEERNTLDLSLYDVARREFAARIERQGEDYTRALRRLTRFNPLYNAVSTSAHACASLLPRSAVRNVRRTMTWLQGGRSGV